MIPDWVDNAFTFNVEEGEFFASKSNQMDKVKLMLILIFHTKNYEKNSI